MSLSVIADNTTTATINTEHDLGSTLTAANVYGIWIDVSAMAGGVTPDILEIRIYDKARAGGTERLVKVWSLIGVQSEALWVSPPYISTHHFRATIKQTQGTGRSFPWSIRQCQ